MHWKRFLRYLVVAFGTVAVLAAIANIDNDDPTRNELTAKVHEIVSARNRRIEAENAERLRLKAEEWVIFCMQYDCDDIPEGYIVKSIGQDTLSLLHVGQPFTGDTCRITTDSYDETEYVDGKVVRGAALKHIANPFFTQCGERMRPTIWEDRILLYKGQLRVEEPSRNHAYLEVLGPSRSWEANAKPTYVSRRGLLHSASQDFDLFDHPSLENLRRVYLSKTRMFQGRHVVLICGDICDMQTISFAEDASLTSLHFAEVIQFTFYDWDCGAFTAIWKCGPPMEEFLDSMANYVRFLDEAVERAQRPPLSKLR